MKLFTCRGTPGKQWMTVPLISMLVSGIGGPGFAPILSAQTPVQTPAPVAQDFVVDAGDLRFIYEQILVAQDHAAGGQLLGPGPHQVADPQLPRGLRTVDGTFNNLVPVPDQHLFGAADQKFPRQTTPRFRLAEAGTSYEQTTGNVIDSQPRIATNLIVDQTDSNPAAVAVATNPCGSGGFVCSPPESATDPTDPLASVRDPNSGALFIPNITPDFGLSAPFNLMFTFFGQFFDHGLDLIPKSGDMVIIPLQPDDPLLVGPHAAQPPIPANQRFMAITRGTMLKDAAGNPIHESVNVTTPWVDQNQTYTSHPAHQVFLRQYAMENGRPVPDGKVLDGGDCAQRATGIPGDEICNIGNWADVKAQARTKLGIDLVDQDVFNVPLLLTDPYGHFTPGPHGFPQLVLTNQSLLEGNPAAPVPTCISNVAASDARCTGRLAAFGTGHAFLDDIAHNAVPGTFDNDGNPATPPVPKTADPDLVANSITALLPRGTYDNELLNAHFVTGDGRGNENIALTMVHNIFHAEHNRLASYIDQQINAVLTPAASVLIRVTISGSIEWPRRYTVCANSAEIAPLIDVMPPRNALISG